MLFAASSMFRAAASSVKAVGKRYADFSNRHPYYCSTLTAFGVLGWADITAQQLTTKFETGSLQERLEKHDYQRTLALTMWGTWHYGIPQKYWYLSLDRFLGKGRGMQKMVADVYANTPFHLIPSFYIFTGILKRHPYLQVNPEQRQYVKSEVATQDHCDYPPMVPTEGAANLPGKRAVDPNATVASIVGEEIEHLKNDWFEASFGSALFWTPLVYANFTFVPQHSRIMTIVTASFLHKTWLSWLSHRQDNSQVFGSGEVLSVEEPMRENGLNLLELAHEKLREDAETLSAQTARNVGTVASQTKEFIGFAGGTAVGAAGTAGLMLATTGGGRRPPTARWQPRSSHNFIHHARQIPPVRCFVDVHRDRIPKHGDLPVASRPWQGDNIQRYY